MCEVTRIEQQRDYDDGKSTNIVRRSKNCELYCESREGLQSLLNQWTNEFQQAKSINNEMGSSNNIYKSNKGDGFMAHEVLNEPLMRPPSAASGQQAQQVLPNGNIHQPPIEVQKNDFHAQMFYEKSFLIQYDPALICLHQNLLADDEAQRKNSNAQKVIFHPYQHQRHFSDEQTISVKSTSSVKTTIEHKKRGLEIAEVNQFNTFMKSDHTMSSYSYPEPSQCQRIDGTQEIDGSQQWQKQQNLIETSLLCDQWPQRHPGCYYSGIKSSAALHIDEDLEERDKILDLDLFKVQTHRYEMELVELDRQKQQQKGETFSMSGMLGLPMAQSSEYRCDLPFVESIDRVSQMTHQGLLMESEPVLVQPEYYPDSPVVTSTQSLSDHQTAKAVGTDKQSTDGNSFTKSHNCTTCNKVFTSSQHLKRHYNTKLHKNAVKRSDRVSSGHSGSGKGTRLQKSPESATPRIVPNWIADPLAIETKKQKKNSLPSFGIFRNDQSSLPGFTQFGIANFLVGGTPESKMRPQAYIDHVQQAETNNDSPRGQGEENRNSTTSKQSNENRVTSVITDGYQVTSTKTGPQDRLQESCHKCIQCNKVFNKSCYLTQHNNSFHSGEKPFKCNLCGKRFALDHLYMEHHQKHVGEKPHKCDVCPKQFHHKTDLRRHMCLHTGEKPYACNNCGKSFIRKDHMLKHSETHRRAVH